MKASYNWLRDYCPFELPAHELAARLSHSGLNVDSYEPRGDDWMLDVEIKSNRPDCLCHIGIAREIAAITDTASARPVIELHQGERPWSDAAAVDVSAPELCPHYTARVVTGVQVGPSPQWMQHRLTTCGVRPVNNVVDITNYVMLEAGQPLHAFDLALLDGNHIIVRQAQAGETITLIDGSELELEGTECVIADEHGPVALAGVMGGLESEISETTTDVLLEAARFDPVNNRRTSRAHQVASLSSYRFQRGIDPQVTDWASRRACQFICDLAGGTLLRGNAELRFDETPTPQVTMRFARLALVLGIHVPPQKVMAIFRGLDLQLLHHDEEAVTVQVPSWRRDLTREVDLIEEVARIHGYDKISETTEITVRTVVPAKADIMRRRARQMLAGEGFCEAMTYTLITPDDVQLTQPWTDQAPIELRNPVTVDRTHLRLTQMANLLDVKRLNEAHGTAKVDLFELGAVYLPKPGQQLPCEKQTLALLTDRDHGLRVLKGVLDNLLGELGIPDRPDEEPTCAGPFRDDMALVLRLGGDLLGAAGVVDEGVAEELDLRTRPTLMELDFDLLIDRARIAPAYQPVPEFPAMSRDLAVVVDEQVLWADLERSVRKSAPDTLESIQLFDIYRGDPVPDGRKSVAFELTLRRPDSTMTADEAETAVQNVLEALRRELGADLR